MWYCVSDTMRPIRQNNLASVHFPRSTVGSMDTMAEMRQRRKERPEPPQKVTESIFKRVKQLDAYPKIGEDYRVQTTGGGLGASTFSFPLITDFF